MFRTILMFCTSIGKMHDVDSSSAILWIGICNDGIGVRCAYRGQEKSHLCPHLCAVAPDRVGPVREAIAAFI